MIRLHHCHQTRSMRTLWLLHELGIEFDVQTYPFDKTLRQEPFKSLNPVGRVPALEIDGLVLTESGAIAELLCERFPEARLGRLPGDPGRAEWLQWIHFAETISQHVAALTQQHVMLYEDQMRSDIIITLEPKRLAKTLAPVEAALTGDFLLGQFTAADIGVGQAVYMAQHFVRLDPFPRVVDWLSRLQTRPAFALACPDTPGLYAQDFYPPPEPAQ